MSPARGSIKSLTCGLRIAHWSPRGYGSVICADQEGGKLVALAGILSSMPGTWAWPPQRLRKRLIRRNNVTGRDLSGPGPQLWILLPFLDLCRRSGEPGGKCARFQRSDPDVVAEFGCAYAQGWSNLAHSLQRSIFRAMAVWQKTRMWRFRFPGRPGGASGGRPDFPL